MKIHEITDDVNGISDTQREKYRDKITSKKRINLELYLPKIELAIAQYKQGNTIWRGVPSKTPIMLIDPSKVERSAANTANYMNILQSMLPSWKGYPPRNRSFICSEHRGYAANFLSFKAQQPHVVLPFGNPVIGIVPRADWWQSVNVTGINSALYSIFEAAKRVNNTPNTRKLSNKSSTFMADLKFIETVRAKYKTKLVKYVLDNYYVDDYIVKELLSKPILTSLDKMTDPTVFDFSKVQLSQFKSKQARELWFSSPALLVHEDVLRQFIKEQE
jgi:hypothetical protein